MLLVLKPVNWHQIQLIFYSGLSEEKLFEISKWNRASKPYREFTYENRWRANIEITYLEPPIAVASIVPFRNVVILYIITIWYRTGYITLFLFVNSNGQCTKNNIMRMHHNFDVSLWSCIIKQITGPIFQSWQHLALLFDSLTLTLVAGRKLTVLTEAKCEEKKNILQGF